MPAGDPLFADERTSGAQDDLRQRIAQLLLERLDIITADTVLIFPYTGVESLDADYCRRVVASGGQCTYLPRVSVQHLGGGSAKYTLPRAIRAFHKSAYQLYWKHAGTGGRMAAPLVRAGLHLRGEMRLRSALRELSAAAAARRQPVVSVDHISNAARAPAEAKHSVQGV